MPSKRGLHRSAKNTVSKMVVWADFERKAIKNIFSKVKQDTLGPAALARCLIVYPWTLRYFGKFGDLSDAAAIKSNAKVAEHGKTVLRALVKALDNMDNIKDTYKDLSILHSETLNVDPRNFTLLANCVTIEVAGQLGSTFTAEFHAAFQKFLAVVVAALKKQYY
ncbi:hemoglobin subunit beta-like [Thalassophryne amazonica]|uniref:hemoglobin subunit beta-like n=1 Tax=Thalassophryne amazonica TaxID=390379 RepID=UPI001470F5FC|nr:hemoglobin subunit beta-like [Thalassophryne amazonica]